MRGTSNPATLSLETAQASSFARGMASSFFKVRKIREIELNVLSASETESEQLEEKTNLLLP